MSEVLAKTAQTAVSAQAERRRLDELACRSLLAEQSRQLAHSIRTPLSVIDLISETLQLELKEDADKSERIGQILSASGRISLALTEGLRAAVFPESEPQIIDVWTLAARLTRQQGGLVEAEGDVTEGACQARIAPDAFEAAILHGLGLVAEGGRSPVLSLQRRHDRMSLLLTAKAAVPGDPKTERLNRRLMRQVIERVARDADGSCRCAPGLVELELPLAPTR